MAACCLFSAKSLSELTQVDVIGALETNVKIWIKIQFLFKKNKFENVIYKISAFFSQP